MCQFMTKFQKKKKKMFNRGSNYGYKHNVYFLKKKKSTFTVC